MSPTQARELAHTLIEAADKAEAAGISEIDLLSDLWADVDAARAELQAAIDAASE